MPIIRIAGLKINENQGNLSVVFVILKSGLV